MAVGCFGVSYLSIFPSRLNSATNAPYEIDAMPMWHRMPPVNNSTFMVIPLHSMTPRPRPVVPFPTAFPPARFCSLMAGVVMLAVGSLHAQLSEESFREPPLEARPAALWTWMNAHVDHQQLTRELEEMKDKGMRGAIIWDMGALSDPKGIIPVGPPFLGPESLASIHHVIDQAGRLGLEMGLSSSSSWNAGGPWIQNEDGCQTLAWATLKVTGPQQVATRLPLPEKVKDPTTTLAVIAVPGGASVIEQAQAIRLEQHVAPDGALNWSAPQGEWTILHFVSTATGQQLMCPSPKSKGLMTDHLSARATRVHLNHVMEAITKGRKDLGALKTLFLDSYEVKTPIDWTPEFVQAFRKANGYDPLPWLPVLAGMTVSSEDLSNRFRHDYGKLVSDLVVDNHYALAREIANQHGLKLIAEAGHGGHARFDTLKALGAADIPMGEYWNHRKNWCVKEAASAANLYGKPLVNAESMTGWQHWQDGPQMYKRLTDIAFCAGLNQITFHTFAHNPPEAGLPGYAYHAGEHFNVNLTWWPQARPMLDSLSRSCHLLQQGRCVADVCAYYGDNAPNLVPARRITPTIEPLWPEDKCQHCGKPLPVDLASLGHSHDYDYLNEEILVEKMEVRDGRLTLPNGMEYQVLVLPDRTTISPEALTKIEQLVRDGATVVGPKPERSNSMRDYPRCDENVRAIAGRIWGNCNGKDIRGNTYGKGKVVWNQPLAEVLKNMDIAPDFTLTGIDNSERKIDYIHRTTGAEEIYFLTNTSEEDLEFEAGFRVGEGYQPSFWNPEDGSVTRSLHYRVEKGITTMPIRLPAITSVFVVFRKQATTEHITKVSSHGPSPELTHLEGDKAGMLVTAPGTYTVTTSSGRGGSASVNAIPPAMPITGPWKITFPPDRGAPASATFDTLIDWANHDVPGIRYYSGTATYEKSFTIDEALSKAREDGARVELDLGQVREVASVILNGKELGILWKPPYRIDITRHLKAGENRLVIRVTNAWNNRLVGDAQSEDDKNITRTNMDKGFKKNSPLLSSGIIGPVTLETSLPLTIDLDEKGK